jgi:hypothetical protein
MNKRYRIIETDNFGGDYPNEKWATPYSFTKEQAAIMRECFNSLLSGETAPRYWREVEEGYQLQPGLEGLIRLPDYAKDPKCPHCLSEKLEWTPDVTFNGSFISQKVICNDCFMAHEAIYELADYEDML